MPWTQHFTVEGQYFGSAVRRPTTWTKDGSPPDGYAFVCPTCAASWSVCPVEGRPFSILTRGCPQHRRISGDGSVWTGWDSDFTEALPHDLLQRELNLLLEGFPP
jgi:hypothetical protein